MRHIVEYKLHNGAAPYFIADGGYFFHNNKCIGITVDSKENHVPKVVSEGGDLVDYSSLDLVAEISARVILGVNRELSVEEKTELVGWWLSDRGL